MKYQRLLFVASLFLGSLYASVAYGSSNQYLSADNGNVSGFTRYKMSAPKTDFEVKQQSDCTSLSAQSGGAHRVWSDKPAFEFFPLPQGEIDKAHGVLVQDPNYQ